MKDAFEPRPIALRHMKSLASIQQRLLDLSDDWSEVDEVFRSELSELADKCESLRAELAEVYPGKRSPRGAA